MKGVQCYELFGGIAFKNHTFSFILKAVSLKKRRENKVEPDKVIQHNLKHANRDLREIAYISFVMWILEYSSTVWDPFYQESMDRLERV